MAFFRNEAPGARMIRLTDRTFVLIDPGKIGRAPREKVAAVPAGVVEVDEEGDVVDLPDVPTDVAAQASASDRQIASANLAAVAIQGSAAETVDAANRLRALDHDGDGKPGGSQAQDPTEALKEARAAYKAKFGKLPFNGWPIEELQRRMEAPAEPTGGA
ncbi:hypothetical protein [Rhizorhabdus histidinilytica]|uniref:hypothetical protein n=1 Tax=Rhizorhabdus histidinilytica TaxID=439228 RepID=UPI00321FF13D